MKRTWTRSEKWLWAAPLLFLFVAGAMTFGSDIARRALGRPERLMTTPDTDIYTMALSRNGEILAASGSRTDRRTGNPKRGSGTIHLWNARTGQPLVEMAPVYPRVGEITEALALSPDATKIGFAGMSGKWQLYDVATQRLLWSFSSDIEDAVFSLDGRSIILLNYAKISIVNSSNGKVLKQWKRGGPSNSLDVDLSPDGKFIANIGPFDPTQSSTRVWRADIELYRADTGKFVRRIRGQNNQSVNFSPDSKKLIVASMKWAPADDETLDVFAPVRCYDVATGNLLWEVKTPAFGGTDSTHAAFCDATFSPNGRTVAAYQLYQGKVFLLDSATGAIKTTYSLGKDKVTTLFRPPALAFSPDGKRLFTRGKNAIVFWDLN